MGILILVVTCFIAVVFGYQVPRWWEARPRFAVLLAAVIPALALYLLYMTNVRAGDWEGMGALVFTFLGVVWIVIVSAAGLLSMRRVR